MNHTDRILKLLIALAFLAASAALWWPVQAQAVRLKEIAAVQGVRNNQLMGYGLVVGLQGTGDGSDVPFSGQSLRAMLNQLGVSIDGPLSDFDNGGTVIPKLDVKNAALFGFSTGGWVATPAAGRVIDRIAPFLGVQRRNDLIIAGAQPKATTPGAGL